MPEDSNKNQKKCPRCGFDKSTDSFAGKKICDRCAEKNKPDRSSLFGKKKSTGDDEDSSGGARKLELKHTRDVETLGNEIKLDREAQVSREALEKKDKKNHFLVRQKTFIEQQERTLLTSEETLDKEATRDELPSLDPEPEKQEEEKIPKPDDGPSDSSLKNSSRFRQTQKGQLDFFENRRQMNTKETNQKQKVSQLYSIQKKSDNKNLMSEETKAALSVAFRRWR